MNVLDLFSGIGGFSLGLERAGMRTVAFCEIDPFCRRVLAKHWPNVPCYDDVRTLTAARLRADGIAVDVICGGFPCQDISTAGKGAGINGERSGLWSEYARIIGDLRPSYVIVENVAALLGRGLDRVLGDLAALGFDAEWHCIPASAVGAPHRRDRIWIIATNAMRRRGRLEPIAKPERKGSPNAEAHGTAQPLAHTAGERRREAGQHRKRHSKRTAGSGEILAHADERGVEGLWSSRLKILVARYAEGESESCSYGTGQPWAVEPDVGRVAHGVPSRVDRLRSLGNAVVPQIPEIIGRAIMTAHIASDYARAG